MRETIIDSMNKKKKNIAMLEKQESNNRNGSDRISLDLFGSLPTNTGEPVRRCSYEIPNCIHKATH